MESGATDKVSPSLRCSSCNTEFSSQELLTKHAPCCASSFDLSRVKTEVEDCNHVVQGEVETPASVLSQIDASVAPTESGFSNWNVKTEIKSEIPEVPLNEDQGTDSSNTDFQFYSNSNSIRIIPRYRGRRGRPRGLRRGGGVQRGGIYKPRMPLQKAESTMFQGLSVMSLGLQQLRASHSKVTNILPKAGSNSLGNGPVSTSSSLELTNPSSSVAQPNVVIPSSFTISNLSGTEGPNVGTMPFNQFILGNNIVTNGQQDTLFLGGSTPLMKSLPGASTLPAPTLVPGFQTINLSQPLTNFPNMTMTSNQNPGLGIHQNLGQVFNSGAQNGAVFAGNISQTVGSVVTPTVSPSQSVPYKVPVLVGNQIILIDTSTQFQGGVPLASTPATISLPCFGIFSSAISPVTNTQSATSCIASTTMPCHNLLTNNIQAQTDVKTATLNIASQLQPQPVTANIIGVQKTCENVRTLKSPPPLLMIRNTVLQPESQDTINLTSVQKDTQSFEKMTPGNDMSSVKTWLNTVKENKILKTENQSNTTITNVNFVSQQPVENGKHSADVQHLSDAQNNILDFGLPVRKVTNISTPTESEKSNIAPVSLNGHFLNRKQIFRLTSKANVVSDISAPVKTSCVTEIPQNVLPLKMEMPNMIEQIILPSNKEDKGQSHGLIQRAKSDKAGMKRRMKKEERIPKTVIKMLQDKASHNPANQTKSSPVQALDHQLQKVMPKFQRKLHSRKLPCQLLPGKIASTSNLNAIQLASKLTRLPGEQRSGVTVVGNDQSFSSPDGSDKSQSDNEVICKISEVKSIADVSLSSQALLLSGNNPHNLDYPGGTVFVGPLSREQLDVVIKDPSELEKYVSLPNGHVLSSKAIVVPAASTASTVPLLVPSTAASQKPLFDSVVSGYSESQFVRIHPKPNMCPQPIQAQSLLITPNPSNSMLANLVPVTTSSTSSVSLVAPTAAANSLSVVPDKVTGRSEKTAHEKNTDARSSSSLSNTCKKKKRSSRRQGYELQCKTIKDSQSNGVMKLSFNGDINLLKDALRKATVRLEALDPKTVENIFLQSKSDTSDSSDSSKDDYKPRYRKKKRRNSDEVMFTRKVEKTVGSSSKRWVPLEVVGDLAIRGKLLECDFVSSREAENGGIRRSDRISAKPRLDYSDLERLPFQDLDNDTEESDPEFEISHPSPQPQSPASLPHRSQPQSAALPSHQPQQQSLVPPSHPSLQLQPAASPSHRSPQPQFVASPSHPSLHPQPAESPSLPSLQPQPAASPSHPSPQPGPAASPSPPILEQMQNQETPAESPVEAGNTHFTSLVVDSQEMKDINDKNSVSSQQVNNFDECYYSSESESDMFDTCDAELKDAGRKKIMWKRHSEITLFLVKHAGRFHSDDNGEHYCNICCKYKTNGIFRLSHHLKSHLGGHLKCPQCDFEASHELSLVEHRKTHQAL